MGGGRAMEIHEKRKIAVVVRDWFCFGVGKVGNEMKLGSNCCIGVVNVSESVSMIRCLKKEKYAIRSWRTLIWSKEDGTTRW
jgi:hypothetical protein